MGLSAENVHQFQSFHSPNMFIVVYEAEGVSDEIYEVRRSHNLPDVPLGDEWGKAAGRP